MDSHPRFTTWWLKHCENLFNFLKLHLRGRTTLRLVLLNRDPTDVPSPCAQEKGLFHLSLCQRQTFYWLLRDLQTQVHFSLLYTTQQNDFCRTCMTHSWRSRKDGKFIRRYLKFLMFTSFYPIVSYLHLPDISSKKQFPWLCYYILFLSHKIYSYRILYNVLS